MRLGAGQKNTGLKLYSEMQKGPESTGPLVSHNCVF